MNWTTFDTWIVIAGVLSAVACAIPGSFLLLRRMSMMGDAISHAVLPGLAIAFLLTGTRTGVAMFLGAVIVGVLTALFTQWITRFGKVDEGASMGVVFTTLFAIGLVAIVRAADHVDLDPGCVLYGAIELVPLDTLRFGAFEVPRVVAVLAGVTLINIIFTVVFFKELRITAFDPALATTLGINANMMHYLLMVLIAVTTVACFESVGSILVIAMLIVPPAAAYLLTDRLGVMVILGCVIAAVSALGGHVSAIVAPGWFGYRDMSTNTSGMMAVVSGIIFLLALLASPRHGLISRALHRWQMGLQILSEDILALIYRLEERDPEQTRFASTLMRETLGAGRLSSRLGIMRLLRQGLLVRAEGAYHVTDKGRDTAAGLVRTHRLWESYLHRHANVAAVHIHPTAEELEHVTSEQMRSQLEAETRDITHDPHGSAIPPREQEDETKTP